ncbi:MAG TPA: ImmA/IrrE family metallo-endopeptidase [candidate division Zixibacteria bacterium]|nr:ImmA/IrrE family metallo-endopeptidase [candidate division Zixibacteria bacterium]
MTKTDSYTHEEVDYFFAGVNEVSEPFRRILNKALARLPKAVVDWTAENLLFTSPSDDDYAFSLSRGEWQHRRGFVFLYDSVKDLTEERQAFIIAREVAHHKLGHKNAIFNELTEKEAAKQEWEADTLANEWLRMKEK